MAKKTSVEIQRKIIKTKLSNPDISNREVARQLGLKRWAVDNTVNSIPDIVSPEATKKKRYIDTLDSIIDWIAAITEKHIKALQDKEIEKASDLKAYNEIADANWKRKQILQWGVTDRLWVDVDLDSLSDEEAYQRLQAKLRK